MNTRCPPKRVPSAARFFTLCRITVQLPQSYSVGGQRSSGQLTGKPAGARPDYRGRWCAVLPLHPQSKHTGLVLLGSVTRHGSGLPPVWCQCSLLKSRGPCKAGDKRLMVTNGNCSPHHGRQPTPAVLIQNSPAQLG
ncbi:UNVERIFIED_CONTAM: hypothetical protein FKN15_006452 [Acipenser sinensis]